jgi:hypothetical protein
MVRFLKWGNCWECVLEEDMIENYNYIFLSHSLEFRVLSESLETIIVEKTVDIDDVPEEIRKMFQKKLDDPFFEIDFERYKQKIGWKDRWLRKNEI